MAAHGSATSTPSRWLLGWAVGMRGFKTAPCRMSRRATEGTMKKDVTDLQNSYQETA
jgi:hypothetical protein